MAVRVLLRDAVHSRAGERQFRALDEVLEPSKIANCAPLAIYFSQMRSGAAEGDNTMRDGMSGNGSNRRKVQTAPLEVTIMSFGYKEGVPPIANLVFDVRFLKNPFWVEELKPLTGRDQPVQDFVLQQPMAVEFLKSVMQMLDALLPKFKELKINDFSIAFGCTGGQHRSATMAEALASAVREKYSDVKVTTYHRELDGAGLGDEKDISIARVTAEQLKAET